ncbi:MAG: anthranilate synthase component I family protein, partial [Planctomycetales bacterium]
QQGDPFDRLRSLLAEYSVPTSAEARQRFPLLAGAVGYFGYEAGQFIERFRSKEDCDQGIPDIQFALYDTILCHCHQSNQTYLSVVGRGTDAAAAVLDTERSVGRIQTQLESPPTPAQSSGSSTSADEIRVETCFDEKSYCRAVDEIKQHIVAGDIYQACMSQQFKSPLIGGSDWDLYRELRRINPAPFACFLKAPEFSVVGASPERFLSVDKEGHAESRPIKGTRPRGATREADEALRDELVTSVKDKAENVMIVDLVRNDFGRVCQFHSIRVTELMSIETYATVFQMVSTILGKLAPPYDAIDLIRASFPGGSMTGAPKIEAIKILETLEPVERGIYAGAIGFLDYQGAIDLSIVIRSFVIKDGWCHYHAGGAVVADSDPRAEYLESLDKISALKSALAHLLCKG